MAIDPQYVHQGVTAVCIVSRCIYIALFAFAHLEADVFYNLLRVQPEFCVCISKHGQNQRSINHSAIYIIMGQEISVPVDDSTPSETLKARNIEAVADYVKAGRARNIVVMVGMPFLPLRDK